MGKSSSCRTCLEPFEISDHHLAFLERAAPQVLGKTLKYSEPLNCPCCRESHRLSWRNDRSLYPRECGLCNRRIISCYSPLSGIRVYCSDCWHSDRWDPLDYGRPFDPNRTFMEQFRELLTAIPHLALYNLNHENSEYCNHAASMKDCYLVYASALNEKTLYATRTWKNFDCVDIVESGECQICYDVIDCHRCYKLFSSTHCTSCSESYFLFDCHSCDSCFGSANLRQAQYVWFNQQLSKADYESRIRDVMLGSRQQYRALKARAYDHIANQIHRHCHLTACEGCTGDQLVRGKDSTNCFNLSEPWDCHFCELGFSPKDSYDASGISEGELCYGIVNHIGSTRCCAGIVSYYNDDCHYCYHCQNCKNVLGSVGLRHKNFVLLNVEYSKEDYNAACLQIYLQMRNSGTWGEFFPGICSPFGYNETEAHAIYPLDEGEALKRGFAWSSFQTPAPAAKLMIDGHVLPDNIQTITDDFLDHAILCDVSKRPFKVTARELTFYRLHSLPFPTRHPDSRYKEILSRRNPRKLFDRHCSLCNIPLVSTYPVSDPRAIACDKCYNSSVFGA